MSIQELYLLQDLGRIVEMAIPLTLGFIFGISILGIVVCLMSFDLKKW